MTGNHGGQTLPKILQLKQHVADLIAAGEVVQRPASVVKELMENSIDSGAAIITVEINSGGMTYIRVTDDGCGIAPEDAKTAFLRHATSKLKDAHDLEAIGTLGFRGEALAAIAAVSRVDLMTRQAGSNEGVSLSLESGDVVDTSPTGCPEGTTIIVRDLFFNTPARMKFMKSDRAEGSSVTQAVLRCALSRPDISIRFIKDGRTEYHTPGDSRIDSCVYSLLGRDFEAGFIKAQSADEAVSVNGFVSTPAAARGNRSYQFFFVNGRVIRSQLIQTALEQAYKNVLPSGRFPSCVLYITIKPGSIDVNVHPAKTEVKFYSDKQIFDGVYYAALGALEDSKIFNIESQYTNPVLQSDNTTLYHDSGSIFNTTQIKEKIILNIPAEHNINVKTGDTSMHVPFDVIYDNCISESSGTYIPYVSHEVSGKNDIRTDMFLCPDPIRVIGEAFNVYIIIEYKNSIWFIDKHAAHERLHFDALRSSNYESMSEALIMPVICRLGHEDVSLLLENDAFIEALGFTVENFGDDSVAIRHIPAEIDIGDTESILSDICDQLKKGGSAVPVQRDVIYKIIACKAAIKAGRSSGKTELEILAAKVMSGEAAFCPHGRPVAYEISKSTLEKIFGRT